VSRSGYSDDCSGPELALWRGAVNSAIKGKRGQQFLRELAAAMDAMPEKVLISGELQVDGQYCALGVVGAARGLPMDGIDLDRDVMARLFGIAPAMAAEIMFENDDDYGWKGSAPAERWQYMRNWVASLIAPPGTP
jgi:hypothetical protein